jgi:hypothetical protein
MATMDPGQRARSGPPRRMMPEYSQPRGQFAPSQTSMPNPHRPLHRPMSPEHIAAADKWGGPQSQQIPPELLQMLMAMLMDSQGGGGMASPRRMMPEHSQPRGQFAPSQTSFPNPHRPLHRPMSPEHIAAADKWSGPRGSGRPPVIKIEDLVRALSGGGGQRRAPQANMPVPQARR